MRAVCNVARGGTSGATTSRDQLFLSRCGGLFAEFNLSKPCTGRDSNCVTKLIRAVTLRGEFDQAVAMIRFQLRPERHG
jgi:hypothetical protein